ncbi:MAG: ATP-dependent zinc protease [Aureliella sp.]
MNERDAAELHEAGSQKNLPVIGWREWVALPEFGIGRIKAKVDSGARSSALHVAELESFEKAGSEWVRFKIYPRQRRTQRVVVAEAPLLEYREVRSSNGKVAERPVITVDIVLGEERWNVELTLANRASMGFRMLLGREAFRGRFLVDAAASYCGGKPILPTE